MRTVLRDTVLRTLLCEDGAVWLLCAIRCCGRCCVMCVVAAVRYGAADAAV